MFRPLVPKVEFRTLNKAPGTSIESVGRVRYLSAGSRTASNLGMDISKVSTLFMQLPGASQPENTAERDES